MRVYFIHSFISIASTKHVFIIFILEHEWSSTLKTKDPYTVCTATKMMKDIREED